MDEQQTSTSQPQSTSANRGGVMDVQPPQTNASAPSSPVNANEVSNDASTQNLATPPNDSALNSSETNASQPAVSSQPPANEEIATDGADTQLLAAQQPQKTHTRTPRAVVAVAVVVAVLLIGLSVLAYMKTQENHDTAHDSTSQTENKSMTETPATTEDVDKTTSEIDKTLDQTNADKDFPASDVSDQTLGL